MRRSGGDYVASLEVIAPKLKICGAWIKFLWIFSLVLMEKGCGLSSLKQFGAEFAGIFAFTFKNKLPQCLEKLILFILSMSFPGKVGRNEVLEKQKKIHVVFTQWICFLGK